MDVKFAMGLLGNFNLELNSPWFIASLKIDAFAKTYRMAKQKFRHTRLGVFSGVKAYI
jgi:hypothetical protein